MSTKINLRNVRDWQTELGMLPVPLYRQGDGKEHVLLNGQGGNFCFGSEVDRKEQSFRDVAWSSAVDCYIQARGDGVRLFSWNQGLAPEHYPTEVVRTHLDEFHTYVQNKFRNPDNTIVHHVINAYRSFRAAEPETISAQATLDGFLLLLAAAAENTQPGQVNLDDWKLDERSLDACRAIPQATLPALTDILLGNRRADRLRPELRLTLRHAAGQLFQEAHYETVAYSRQLWIPGIAPTPARLKEKTPSIGVYFTPPMIARAIVEEAYNLFTTQPAEITAFDPACGSGEFLREVVRQAELHGFTGTLRLIGWDISPAAVAMTKFVLAWEAKNTNIRIQQQISEVNALDPDAPWPTGVSMVAMNPPFLAWPDLSKVERDQVTHALGSLSKGRPDLATVFVYKAVQSLAPGGVIGSVVPASLLDGESSMDLRGTIQSQVSVRLLARLGGQRLFSRATIDAGLFIARREQGGQGRVPMLSIWVNHEEDSSSLAFRALRRTRLSDVAVPVDQRNYSIYSLQPDDTDQPVWAVRPYRTVMLLDQLKRLPRVSKLFDVVQGTLTGNNKAFLVNQEMYARFGKAERAYFRPALVNSSIQDGSLEWDLYVFYPYNQDGLILENEKELAAKVPTYYAEMLKPMKAALLKRSRVKPECWWRLSEYRAWQSTPFPKLVSTYFGSKGSFAWDGDGASVVVQGYSWLPKQGGRRIYEGKRHFHLPEHTAHAYVALLNSDIVDKLLSGISNHVGGGQWNLSKRFVDKLPIPDLFNDEALDPVLIRELSAVGKAIAARRPYDKDEHAKLATAAFGLK